MSISGQHREVARATVWLFVVWRFVTAGAHSVVLEIRASCILSGHLKCNNSFSMNNGEYLFILLLLWKGYMKNRLPDSHPHCMSNIFTHKERLTGSEDPERHANEDHETIYCELNSFHTTVSKLKMVSASSQRLVLMLQHLYEHYRPIIHTKLCRFIHPNHKSETSERFQYMFPRPSSPNR